MSAHRAGPDGDGRRRRRQRCSRWPRRTRWWPAVVGWADLTGPAIADELARLGSGPGGQYLVSIRHQVQSEPDPDWLRRPDVIRGLRAVAAAGLCYDLVVRPHQLPAASYAAADVPDLVFVLDHAAKPPVTGGDAGAVGDRDPCLRRAAEHRVQAVRAWSPRRHPGRRVGRIHAEVADVILSAFGADRVMFGSDWPVCLLASDYAGVLALARSLVAACRRRSGRRCSPGRRPACTGSPPPAGAGTAGKDWTRRGRGADRRGDRARSSR